MSYRDPAYSPYDANTPNLEPEEPELADLLSDLQQVVGIQLRVAVPASIAAIVGNQQVHLQPLLMGRFRNASATPLQVIRNCPVMMPAGANYSVKLPLAVGDTGLALFCDRSLDAWLAATSSNQPVDPQDTRNHDLQDAIFVPGLVPFPLQNQDATSDLVISAGTAQVRLSQAGTFKIGSSAEGGPELLSLLDQLVSQLSTLASNIAAITVTCPPSGGPSTAPLNAAAFLDAQATLVQIQANLDAIKSP